MYGKAYEPLEWHAVGLRTEYQGLTQGQSLEVAELLDDLAGVVESLNTLLNSERLVEAVLLIRATAYGWPLLGRESVACMAERR